MPMRLLFYLLALVVILAMSGCACTTPLRPVPTLPEELAKEPPALQQLYPGMSREAEQRVMVNNATLYRLVAEQLRDLQQWARDWAE